MITKEYQSIRRQDPNNYSDTETRALSSIDGKSANFFCPRNFVLCVVFPLVCKTRVDGLRRIGRGLRQDWLKALHALITPANSPSITMADPVLSDWWRDGLNA